MKKKNLKGPNDVHGIVAFLNKNFFFLYKFLFAIFFNEIFSYIGRYIKIEDLSMLCINIRGKNPGNLSFLFLQEASKPENLIKF